MDKFDDATKVSAFVSARSLPRLTPSQQELSQFIEQEQAQARVQESIHKMTSMCWDKCVCFRTYPSPTDDKQKKRVGV